MYVVLLTFYELIFSLRNAGVGFIVIQINKSRTTINIKLFVEHK